MTIGERIKIFRENAHMTQDELAEKIGTTKQTIYKYENNIITNIPSDKIERLSDIFGISPIILMGWDKNFITTEMELYKASARNIINDSESSLEAKCNAKLQEYLCLYARSVNRSKNDGETFHPEFNTYIAMMLNQQYQKERTPQPVYDYLVEKYGKLQGIPEGKSYWYPREEINLNYNRPHTIAAHFDGDEYTEEQLDRIKAFAAFIKSEENK